MRISEIYLSVQGEGPRVGSPTIFIRFAGCNLRCSGWPCDTPHAIFPEQYRKTWKQMDVDEIADEVKKLTQHLEYYNVCLTGGEPFLQKHGDLIELAGKLLLERRMGLVECFSNGAIEYPDMAVSLICFVMDWKLPGSNEVVYPVGRMMNVNKLRSNVLHAVKFTIKDRQDYEVAKQIWQQNLKGHAVTIWYGTVWSALDNSELIGWVLEDGLPWNFTMQVHNHVWNRNERGI